MPKRPIPSNIRQFTGGKRGADAIAKEKNLRAVEPSVEIPPAPEGMTDEGKAHWVDTATKLAGMRVMSKADTDALHMYIESWLRWNEATDMVRQSGLIIRSPKNYPIQNPALAIANKAQEQCLKILTEFGLTPSSRTKIDRV